MRRVRRETRITRLSQGVDASGTLVPEALQRSYDVLSEYRAFMDEVGVARGLLVATSAVRDARNGDGVHGRGPASDRRRGEDLGR